MPPVIGAAIVLIGAVVSGSHPPPPSCDGVVEEAVRAAFENRLEEAGRLLESALERCSDHPGVVRELAGVRFRQDRFEEAGRLASRLVELDPESVWGWELLASSRFLSDDPVGALVAWNRVGRPIVREIRISGSLSESGRSSAIALTRLGISEGDVLTPERLAAGARRLERIPAVSSSRVSYRPVPGGQVDVEGVAATGPRHPFTRPALPGHALRLLGGRVRLEGSDALGRLERWTIAGAIDGDMYAAYAGVSHPAPGAGIWSWGVSYRSGLYRVMGGAGEIPLPAQLDAPEHPGTPVERVTRSGAHWRVAHLPTSWAHGRVTAGIDRWQDLRAGSGVAGEGGPRSVTAAMAGLSLTLDPPERPLNATVWGEGWMSRGTANSSFGRGGIDFGLQPSWRGVEIDVRTGLDAVARDAPPDLRPRFGSGRMATHPMRARSEFDSEGAVRLDEPGPVWIHGGVELRRWGRARLPVTPGAAVFADGVRSARAVDTDRTGAIHVGIGLRARAPGIAGWFRVDWAIDPADGASRFSAAWVQQSATLRPPDHP